MVVLKIELKKKKSKKRKRKVQRKEFRKKRGRKEETYILKVGQSGHDVGEGDELVVRTREGREQ